MAKYNIISKQNIYSFLSYINIENSICFVHIHRSGGTSITNWLEKNIGKNQFRMSSFSYLDKILRYPFNNLNLNLEFTGKNFLNNKIKYAINGGHLRFEDMASLLHQRCPDINIFAVMREPFSTIKSIYGFNLKLGRFDYFQDKIPTLNEYVVARCSDPLIHDQSSFILDSTGNLPKNLTILRFENLQEDFEKYISKIFPDKSFNTDLPFLNKGEKDFNLEIDDHSKNLIKTRFKRDINIIDNLSED